MFMSCYGVFFCLRSSSLVRDLLAVEREVYDQTIINFNSAIVEIKESLFCYDAFFYLRSSSYSSEIFPQWKQKFMTRR